MASDPITGAFEVGSKILDIVKRFVTDPEKQAEATLQLVQVVAANDKGQQAINAVEAASPNWWVAGWRPAVGWVCVSGYAYHYILQPFLVFLLVAFDVQFQADKLPQLSIMELSVMLTNLLGFGAYRTIENIRGTNGNGKH
jgi:hypothetical protein